MSVPAQCTKCAAIFWSRQFDIQNSFGVTLSDCWESCVMPGCGGRARLADGRFNFTPDGIEILKAPDITREMLTALKHRLAENIDKYSSVEELRADIAAIHPTFGELVTVALKSSAVLKDWLQVIAGLITIWVALTQQEPIRIENAYFGPATAIKQSLHPQLDQQPFDRRFVPIPRAKPPHDSIRQASKEAVERWMARPKPKPGS